MNGMFETTGTIDRAFYNKVKSTLLETRQKMMFFGAAGVFVLCAVFLDSDLIFLAGAVILVAEYFWVINRTIKMSLGRLKERVGSESVKTTTRFLEDCVEITYEGAKTETVAVGYDVFSSIIKHDTAYILRTEFKQAVMIFRENMTAEEEDALFAFLKTKPTKIKWK
jgi:hypothetical protein